jgi:hypothetical protein
MMAAENPSQPGFLVNTDPGMFIDDLNQAGIPGEFNLDGFTLVSSTAVEFPKMPGQVETRPFDAIHVVKEVYRKYFKDERGLDYLQETIALKTRGVVVQGPGAGGMEIRFGYTYSSGYYARKIDTDIPAKAEFTGILGVIKNSAIVEGSQNYEDTVIYHLKPEAFGTSYDRLMKHYKAMTGKDYETGQELFGYEDRVSVINRSLRTHAGGLIELARENGFDLNQPINKTDPLRPLTVEQKRKLNALHTYPPMEIGGFFARISDSIGQEVAVASAVIDYLMVFTDGMTLSYLKKIHDRKPNDPMLIPPRDMLRAMLGSLTAEMFETLFDDYDRKLAYPDSPTTHLSVAKTDDAIEVPTLLGKAVGQPQGFTIEPGEVVEKKVRDSIFMRFQQKLDKVTADVADEQLNWKDFVFLMNHVDDVDMNSPLHALKDWITEYYKIIGVEFNEDTRFDFMDTNNPLFKLILAFKIRQAGTESGNPAMATLSRFPWLHATSIIHVFARLQNNIASTRLTRGGLVSRVDEPSVDKQTIGLSVWDIQYLRRLMETGKLTLQQSSDLVKLLPANTTQLEQALQFILSLQPGASPRIEPGDDEEKRFLTSGNQN